MSVVWASHSSKAWMDQVSDFRDSRAKVINSVTMRSFRNSLPELCEVLSFCWRPGTRSRNSTSMAAKLSRSRARPGLSSKMEFHVLASLGDFDFLGGLPLACFINSISSGKNSHGESLSGASGGMLGLLVGNGPKTMAETL